MMAGSLLAYYEKEGRSLPWRADKDPYHVHLSEIMLQQTRVEAVINYYNRFILAFPSVNDLAKAKEEDVLKLWEGLGYYSRARNLLSAAKTIMEKYGGNYPKQKEELLTLPGVGEYTASAIASICFGEKEIPVDGNFLRIYARLNRSEEDISSPKAKKACHDYFFSFLPFINSGLLAQSIMELGQRICIPNGKPLCSSCPLYSSCLAFKDANPENYPLTTKKKEKKIEFHTVFLFEHKGRIGYEKRPSTGLLASLYGFPMEEGFLNGKEIDSYLSEKGLSDYEVIPLGEYEHIFTHKVWKMRGVFIRADKDVTDLVYLSLQERKESFPLPSAFSPIEKAVFDHLNQK